MNKLTAIKGNVNSQSNTIVDFQKTWSIFVYWKSVHSQEDLAQQVLDIL